MVWKSSSQENSASRQQQQQQSFLAYYQRLLQNYITSQPPPPANNEHQDESNNVADPAYKRHARSGKTINDITPRAIIDIFYARSQHDYHDRASSSEWQP